MAALDIAYVYPETSSPVTYEVREFINPSYYKYQDHDVCKGMYWSFIVGLISSQTRSIDVGLVVPTISTTNLQSVQRLTVLDATFDAMADVGVISQEVASNNVYGACYFRGTIGTRAVGYIKGFKYTTAADPSALTVTTNSFAGFVDSNYDKTCSEQARFFKGYATGYQYGLLVSVARSTSTSNWRIVARSFYVSSAGLTTSNNILSVTADGTQWDGAPVRIAPVLGTAYFVVAYETGIRIVNCTTLTALSSGTEVAHSVYDHGDGIFEMAYDAANAKGMLWSSAEYITFTVSGTTITIVSSGENPDGLGNVKPYQYANSTVQFVGESTASPSGYAAALIMPNNIPIVARPVNGTLYPGKHAYYEDVNGGTAPPSLGVVATDGADRLYLRLFGLSGAPEFPGQFSAQIPSLTVAFSGVNDGILGDFDINLPWFSVDFSGTNFMLGSFGVSTPNITALFNGAGALGADIPGIAVSFSGSVHHYGSLDVAFPSITSALLGHVEAFSEISARMPALLVEISGAAPECSGYFAADFPVMSAKFHGTSNGSGEFFIALPSFGAEFTGQKQQVSDNPLAFLRDGASSGTFAALDPNNILHFER